MKKLLLLISSFVLTGAIYAQSSFQVTELIGGAAVQSTYSFSTDTNNTASPTFGEEFKITNTSSSSKLIKIRKVITSMATNTVTAMNHDIYFCYNTTCFTPYVFYSTANIGAGASLPNGSGTSYGLRADFDHNKVIGTSSVVYTIYDSTNTSDFVNITINYNITASVGIKSLDSKVFLSNAAPNPATEVVNFSFDLGSNTDAVMNIYNCLGNCVKTVSLNPALKNAKVDISSLSEGVYFYSVNANGKEIATRRLVIAR